MWAWTQPPAASWRCRYLAGVGGTAEGQWRHYRRPCRWWWTGSVRLGRETWVLAEGPLSCGSSPRGRYWRPARLCWPFDSTWPRGLPHSRSPLCYLQKYSLFRRTALTLCDFIRRTALTLWLSEWCNTIRPNVTDLTDSQGAFQPPPPFHRLC